MNEIKQALMAVVETGDAFIMRYRNDISSNVASKAFTLMNSQEDDAVPFFADVPREVISLYAAFLIAAADDLWRARS